MPVPDPQVQRTRERILLAGDPPSPIDPPTGCRFHTRCPIAQLPRCSDQDPELREIAPDHFAACHFAKPFPIDIDSVATVGVTGSPEGASDVRATAEAAGNEG